MIHNLEAQFKEEKTIMNHLNCLMYMIWKETHLSSNTIIGVSLYISISGYQQPCSNIFKHHVMVPTTITRFFLYIDGEWWYMAVVFHMVLLIVIPHY